MEAILKIEDMTCNCCGGNVEEHINQLDGISSVKIDVDNQKVQVAFNKDIVTLKQIKEKVAEAGYKIFE